MKRPHNADTSSKKRPPLKLQTFRILLSLVRPHTRTFSLGLIALALGAGMNLLLPQILREFIDGRAVQLFEQHPYPSMGLLIALFALQGLFFYWRSYLFGLTSQRVVASLRTRLVSSLIERDVPFFDVHQPSDLVSRLQSDTLLLQDAIGVRLSVLIRYSVQILFGVIMMLVLSPYLAALLCAIFPPLILVSYSAGKKLRRLTRAQQDALGSAAVIATEGFSNIRVVKAFGTEGYEAARYETCNQDGLTRGIERSAFSAYFSSFVSFLMNAGLVFVLCSGLILVQSGGITTGSLIAFILYGAIVAVSFAFVVGAYAELAQAGGALERVYELLPPSPLPLSAATPPPSPAQTLGTISFHDVVFRYPARPEPAALQGISFTLKPGTITALVGPSGSGKSTIASLLLGFYPPTSGSIRHNDTDLEPTSFAALRSRIAVVPQEPALFATSLEENIRYGSATATREEVRAACQQAQILEFVESLPEGFNTPVGESGVQLSAGQRQRIAIARAFLRKPQLLILDEATSSLDSENEHLIQEALSKLLAGRTALVIAHRLSTIKAADEILVLQAGRIIERGTHEALNAQTGLYHDLVARQSLGER